MAQPNCYVTDLRHFVDLLDPSVIDEVPGPARRLGAFLGDVVKCVTAGWDEPRDGCAVRSRCIGRLGRKRCTDRVVARLHPDESIHWDCLTCGENGLIHHWQKTPFDLTSAGNHLFAPLDVLTEVKLSVAEYEAVAAILLLDGPAERVLCAARFPTDDACFIAAPRAWMEHLLEFVAAEANHSRSKVKVALYDAILARTDGLG